MLSCRGYFRLHAATVPINHPSWELLQLSWRGWTRGFVCFFVFVNLVICSLCYLSLSLSPSLSPSLSLPLFLPLFLPLSLSLSFSLSFSLSLNPSIVLSLALSLFPSLSLSLSLNPPLSVSVGGGVLLLCSPSERVQRGHPEPPAHPGGPLLSAGPPDGCSHTHRGAPGAQQLQ